MFKRYLGAVVIALLLAWAMVNGSKANAAEPVPAEQSHACQVALSDDIAAYYGLHQMGVASNLVVFLIRTNDTFTDASRWLLAYMVVLLDRYGPPPGGVPAMVGYLCSIAPGTLPAIDRSQFDKGPQDI